MKPVSAYVRLGVAWQRYMVCQGQALTASVGDSQGSGELRFGNCLCWAGWVGGGLNEETVAPATTSIPGESCPNPSCPARAPKLISVGLSYMYLTLFKLLPLHWSLELVGVC